MQQGLDILKKIKQEYSEIHVIMLTADCSEESKNKAVEYGTDAYIMKPFRPEHIHLALENMMNE